MTEAAQLEFGAEGPEPVPAQTAAAQTAAALTEALAGALHRRFAAPEWLTLEEVLIEERRIDVVAVRMWTRATILAFEVKASRSDWLREMKRPEKADTVMGHCDEFWLVTAKGVAKPEEIPEHWGWFVLQPNGTIRIAKRAPSLKTKIPGRVFWASMLTRVYNGGKGSQRVDEEKRAEYDRGYRLGEQNERRRQQQRRVSDDSRLEDLERIRSALGGASAWDVEQHGAALREALAGARAADRVKALRDQAQRTVELLDAVLQGENPALL